MLPLPNSARLRLLRWRGRAAAIAVAHGLVAMSLVLGTAGGADTLPKSDSPAAGSAPAQATAPASSAAPAATSDNSGKGSPGVKNDGQLKIEVSPRADAGPKPDPLPTSSVPDRPDSKVIDRKTFTLKIPTAWSEATDDPDYKAETHFTINGPDKKNSTISFEIVDKSVDATKLLASNIQTVDGTSVTALQKVKLDTMGAFKGVGMDLKGKILGTYPGGIKVFVFASDHHNIIVTENYWTSEMKDIQSDMDYILQHFVVKD